MYENILAPLDGSENSERALPQAQEIAKAFGATLHLVQVVSRSDEVEALHGGDGNFVVTEQYRRMVDDLINSRLEQSETYLTGVKERLEGEGISVVATVMEGAASEKIVQYAEQENIDLIVISTRGHGGVQRFLLGSTTDRVIRSGHLPVLAVPPGD